MGLEMTRMHRAQEGPRGKYGELCLPSLLGSNTLEGPGPNQQDEPMPGKYHQIIQDVPCASDLGGPRLFNHCWD